MLVRKWVVVGCTALMLSCATPFVNDDDDTSTQEDPGSSSSASGASSAGVSTSSSVATSSSSGAWACAGGRELVPGRQSGSTRNLTDRFSGCSLRRADGFVFTVGAGGNDDPWFFHLDRRQRLQVTFNGYDGSLYLLQGKDCTTALSLATACVDMNKETTEVLDVVLTAGDYWLVVDGYGATTHGDYTLDDQLSDPCHGIPPEGQCTDGTTLTWCSVPPAGIDHLVQATLTCPSGETCQTVQGVRTRDTGLTAWCSMSWATG